MINNNKYCRAEMYAGRVTGCSLVSHGEYADKTDRQMDGRQTVTLRFPLFLYGRGQCNNINKTNANACTVFFTENISHTVGQPCTCIAQIPKIKCSEMI